MKIPDVCRPSVDHVAGHTERHRSPRMRPAVPSGRIPDDQVPCVGELRGGGVTSNVASGMPARPPTN